MKIIGSVKKFVNYLIDDDSKDEYSLEKKTDDRDESILITDEKSSSSSYSNSYNTDSDFEDYDLYNVKYVSNKKNQCKHLNLISILNIYFADNGEKIFNFYFKDRNLPIWMINFMNNINNKNDKNDKLKMSDVIDNNKKDDNNNHNHHHHSLFSLTQNFFHTTRNQYLFTVEKDKAFMIPKIIYNIIRDNFIIMLINCHYNLDEYEKNTLITSVNNSKIKCECFNIDEILDRCKNTEVDFEYCLICHKDSTYYNQNLEHKKFHRVPFEFVLYLFGSFFDPNNPPDDNWIMYNISTLDEVEKFKKSDNLY
jgi:hypothetical protein